MGDAKTEKILALLKQGDNPTLEKIYQDNREAFINFSKKYNIEKYDAVDLYQDAIIALRANAVDGKLNDLKTERSF